MASNVKSFGEVKVEIKGIDRFEQLLKAYGDKLSGALAVALYEEATTIMTDSKENYVPVDQGTLRDSGHVQEPKLEGTTLLVELGYGGPAAPYALAVHENPRSGKTEGVSPSGRKYKHWAEVGQYKYLEIPFKAAAKGLSQRIADRAKRVLGEG